MFRLKSQTTIYDPKDIWTPINLGSIGTFGTGGNINVPVGDRETAFFKPRPGISQVVSGSGAIKADYIPVETTGGNKPSDQASVQIMWTLQSSGNWTLTHPAVGTVKDLLPAGAKILADELGIDPPSAPSANVPNPNSGPTGGAAGGGILGPSVPSIISKQEPTMDLGNLFGQIISGVTQYQVAKAQQPVVTSGFVGPTLTEAAGNVVDYFTDDGVITTSTPIKLQDKCKRRRRRRRLATQSDIRDLAALKAVLGDGQNLKTWIATHSS